MCQPCSAPSWFWVAGSQPAASFACWRWLVTGCWAGGQPGPVLEVPFPSPGPSAPAASRICCSRLHLGRRPQTRAARTACRRNPWRLVGQGWPGVGSMFRLEWTLTPPLSPVSQHPLLALEGTCTQEPVLGVPAALPLWYSQWGHLPVGLRRPLRPAPACSQVRLDWATMAAWWH